MAVLLRGRRFEIHLPTGPVDILQDGLYDARVGELQILPVQLQRGARVLDTVVGLQLDVLAEEVPGQEGEGELAQAGLDEEEVDGVDDLGLWDVDVGHAEVLLEAVPEELATKVEQDPELLVRHL